MTQPPMREDERHALAAELESGIMQLVAGNLFRYDAVRSLLDEGRIAEASDLLEEAVRTQRLLMAELRTMQARLRPDAMPVTP